MSSSDRELAVAIRSRWRLLLWLGVILAAMAIGSAVLLRESAKTVATTAPPPDNLILLTIDALRADHLGVYGYGRNTSPRIDQLAREGVMFTAAQVQWPKTAPSVASFMTSTYCAVNRMQDMRSRLDDRLVTLAEVLRDAGFHTGAFVANVHIGRFFNFTQGFEDVYEMWDTSRGVQLSNKRAAFLPNEQIASHVVEWLRRTKDRRLFLWVHLLDPHGPYLPPASVASRFVGDELFEQQSHPVPLRRVPPYQQVAGYSTLAEFVTAYDAEIVSTDAAVGRILDAIDALGLGNRSLVVLTADHGESLGEHQYFFEHGVYAYQACARVPLMMRYPPRVPAGLGVDTPFAMLDLMPTLLELLDVAPGEALRQLQGRSWAAVFAGGTPPYRPAVTQSGAGQLAVRHRHWKYIFDPRPSTSLVPVLEPEQLYDLQEDPMETRNVIAEHPRLTDKMRSIADQWGRLVRQQAGMFHSLRVQDRALEPELLEQLKSLGYIVEEPGGG